MLREIVNLKKVQSPYVIGLRDVCYSKGEGGISPVLVFDYMEHDLLGLVAKKIKLSSARVRSIFKQMASGLSDLHSKNIIHRDIKSKFNSSKCVGGFKGQCKDSRSGFIS